MRQVLKFILLTFSLQLIASPQDINIIELIAKGDSSLYINKFEQARNFYSQAANLSTSLETDYNRRYSNYKIGYTYLQENSDFLALAIFTDILLDFRPKNTLDSALYFLVNLETDILEFNCIKINYESSYIKERANKYKTYLSKSDKMRLQYLLARMYTQRLEHNNAINSYKKILSQEKPDKWIYENSYYAIAIENERILEFQQAIEYYKLLLELPLLYVKKKDVLDGIWHCYFRLQNYPVALDYLQEAAKMYDPNKINKLINNYVSQGSCYYQLQNNDKALFFYNKAEQIAFSKDSQLENLIYVYRAKTFFYTRTKNYDLAEEYTHKSLNLIQNIDSNSFDYITIYKQAIRHYFSNKNFYKVIQLATEFENSTNATKNLFSKSQNYLKMYRDIQSLKGLAFCNLLEEDRTNTLLYSKAKQALQSALDISKNNFSKLNKQKSKLISLRDLSADYENMFYIEYLNLPSAPSSEQIQRLFYFLQKSKAVIFKDYIKDTKALNTSNIPPNILAHKSRLKNRIERLDFYINNSSSQNIAKEDIANLRQDFILTTLEYNSLITTIKNEYPNYQKKKEQKETLKINEIQNRITDDQIILDYLTDSKRIYTIVIKKDTAFIAASAINKTFKKDVQDYYYWIQEKPYIGEEKASNKYLILSNRIYKQLFSKIEKYLLNQRLCIIPHKELNIIPFETLLTEKVDTLKHIQFGKLPYLIKQNPISILYSESQLYDPQSTLSNKSKSISFAPDYTKFNNTYLSPLSGTTEEVKSVTKYFKGKSYTGLEATKSNFLKKSKNYDIIHLALHTIINKENPKHSQLVFSYTPKKEDSHLSIYEIIDKNYSAKLLVLSGCNTGSGTIKRGEGLMHIARSFFFCGINNIILTQWEVADKSSAILMNYFYNYLHNGASVDIALQKAKIDFLRYEDPTRHHPYYWAGYISTGMPVEYNSKTYRYWFLLLLLIPLTAIIIKIRNN